jgi:hypothetical protein
LSSPATKSRAQRSNKEKSKGKAKGIGSVVPNSNKEDLGKEFEELKGGLEKYFKEREELGEELGLLRKLKETTTLSVDLQVRSFGPRFGFN